MPSIDFHWTTWHYIPKDRTLLRNYVIHSAIAGDCEVGIILDKLNTEFMDSDLIHIFREGKCLHLALVQQQQQIVCNKLL
jgi:hypothetical protein